MEKRNTEKEFITAFWQLYAEKPIEKISIDQLCMSAGYHRSTFYHHFCSIYDLLDRAVSDIFMPIKDKVLSEQNFLAFLQGNGIETTFLSAFSQQNQHIELLFKRKNWYLLGENLKRELLTHITREFKDRRVDLQAIEILLEYQISAVLGVINYWYRCEKRISEQDIISKLYGISSRGFLDALKDELS